MKQDRFLTGILIGIGALVIVALAVFFTRRDDQTYVVDDTPEGVVHNYVVAVLDKDYHKAYGFLADLEHKPTLTEFQRAFLTAQVNPQGSAVEIGVAEISSNDVAFVEVALVHNPSDPFSTGYRDVQRAALVLQNGAWKLTSMPSYYFWEYNWYQEPPK